MGKGFRLVVELQTQQQKEKYSTLSEMHDAESTEETKKEKTKKIKVSKTYRKLWIEIVIFRMQLIIQEKEKGWV